MPIARSTRCQAGRLGGGRSRRRRVCRRNVRSLAHPAAAGHRRRHDPVAGRGTWAARTFCTPDQGRPCCSLSVATIGFVRHLRRNTDRVDARSRGRRDIEAGAGTVTTVSGETALAMSHKDSAQSGGPGRRPAGGWSLRTARGTGAAGATAKAAPPDSMTPSSKSRRWALVSGPSASRAWQKRQHQHHCPGRSRPEPVTQPQPRVIHPVQSAAIPSRGPPLLLRRAAPRRQTSID